MWDSDTYCDFILPDLVGRCQCTAPMKRDGQVCRHDSLVMTQLTTTTTTTIQPTTTIKNGVPIVEDNSSEDVINNTSYVQDENTNDTGWYFDKSSLKLMINLFI